MSKVFVCRCEDVLLSDVVGAIEAGYDDIESLKRYTGFGTGVCQGKSCVAIVGRVLCERTGIDASLVSPFTPRPPLFPLPMRILAGEAAGQTSNILAGQTPNRDGAPPADLLAGSTPERNAARSPDLPAGPSSEKLE